MFRINGVGQKGVMFKFIAVILVFCFAECAAGSCLNYGHACWGAHGKRNGNPDFREPNENSKALKARWFLSKLIQGPIDFRYLRDNDLAIAAKQNSDPLIINDIVEGLNGQELWHKNQDVLADDQLFDDNFLNTADSNRIRLPKVLDKRSTKQN